MTYLAITQNFYIDDENTRELISKLWDREVDSNMIESNPDFHMVDAREENSIGIEQVKDLQDEMRYKPFQERVQIALILDAKKLTVQAQNAFLKTLEDSSDTTVYILVVNNERNLLPTIVSRSKKIYFKTKKGEKEAKFEKDICFENSDMIYCFAIFEKVAKDKIETLQYLDTYLSTLQEQLRNGIKRGVDIEDVTQRIFMVSTTKTRVNANGNRRLLLENLYLQIQDIK